MKSKLALLTVIITLAAVTVLSACSAPPPHETKTIYHPLGNVGLGMTIHQIERIIGDEGFFFELEGYFMMDYHEPDVDLVITYEERTEQAVTIKAFSMGRAFNGVTVGMAYEDVLSICGEYAVEETIGDDYYYDEELDEYFYYDPDSVRYAINLIFNAKNQPVSVTYEQAEDGRVPVFSDDVSHVLSFEFSDGVVDRIEVQYP
ncbi:MAG: hypothetical protein FWH00_05495 [Oscillospiraceae bacterium]|nr:hypothetical protein [Oscillospiraceae bacterium]